MSLIKNLLILVVILGALYFAYKFLIADNSSSLVIDNGAVEGQILASEFLVRLYEIENISFSRELFEDARFRSLVSFSSAPDPVSAGRSNPFTR